MSEIVLDTKLCGVPFLLEILTFLWTHMVRREVLGVGNGADIIAILGRAKFIGKVAFFELRLVHVEHPRQIFERRGQVQQRVGEHNFAVLELQDFRAAE